MDDVIKFLDFHTGWLQCFKKDSDVTRVSLQCFN